MYFVQLQPNVKFKFLDVVKCNIFRVLDVKISDLTSFVVRMEKAQTIAGSGTRSRNVITAGNAKTGTIEVKVKYNLFV